MDGNGIDQEEWYGGGLWRMRSALLFILYGGANRSGQDGDRKRVKDGDS